LFFKVGPIIFRVRLSIYSDNYPFKDLICHWLSVLQLKLEKLWNIYHIWEWDSLLPQFQILFLQLLDLLLVLLFLIILF